MTKLKSLVAAGWFAAAALAIAAPAPAPEKLLPDDTLAFVTVPEVAKLLVFLDSSPVTAYWRDPAMKAFRENFSNVQSNALVPLEKALLIKTDDFKPLLQGQATFAVLLNGWTGEKDTLPAFVAVIDARDKADKLKETLVKLKKTWTDAGRKLRTDKIRDVEFTTWATTSGEITKLFPKSEGADDGDKPKASDKKVEISFGQSDSLFIIGTATKAIERVLIRQAGGSIPAVADATSFQAPSSLLFRDAQAYGWANPQPLLQLALNAEGAKKSPVDPMKVINAIGLAGIKSASFAVKLTDDGSLAEFFLGQPVAERKGLVALLAGEAKPAEPPAFVPADVVQSFRMRMDLAKLWNGIEKAIIDFNPAANGALKLVFENAGKDKDPNFDLRKELFGNFGDDIVFYEKAPAELTVESISKPRSVVLIGSPAPDRLVNAIKILIGTIAPAPDLIKERELLGRKIYALEMGAGGTRVEFTASSGYLAISSDPAMLEQFLRSGEAKTRPLREVEGLTAAAEKIGGTGTGFFGYQNQKEQTRIAIEMAKKMAVDGASTTLGGIPDFGLGAAFDYKLHPAFDQVAKYFGFTVYSGQVSADGYRLRIYGPTPAGARK